MPHTMNDIQEPNKAGLIVMIFTLILNFIASLTKSDITFALSVMVSVSALIYYWINIVKLKKK